MRIQKNAYGDWEWVAPVVAGVVGLAGGILPGLVGIGGASANAEKMKQEEMMRMQMQMQAQRREEFPWVPVAAIGGGVVVLGLLAIVLTRK